MQHFPSFHRNSSTTGIRTARERLSDILNRHYSASSAVAAAEQEKTHEKGEGEDPLVKSKSKEGTRKEHDRMPSSKGEPTDPQLREEVKEEVKAEQKGGGPGKWSAWKSGEMARRYEDRGGDYIDNGENKNKAQKGAPEKK